MFSIWFYAAWSEHCSFNFDLCVISLIFILLSNASYLTPALTKYRENPWFTFFLTKYRPSSQSLVANLWSSPSNSECLSLCSFTTSSLWAHRETVSSVWDTRTGQNREPARQRFLQRESREGREDISSPIWIFKAEHYVDNQIGPSAIHRADFAGSGEVALNHHE